jgi:type II secretory pathway pseudopilin PulG
MSRDRRATRSDCTPKRRAVRDRGESLIEIIITIVVISVSVTGLVSALATATASAKSHRDLVVADSVMRNFAEAAKAGAGGCTVGAPLTVAYSPPAGYSLATQPANPLCPTVDSTLLLTLSVTGPVGVVDTMQIRVRTP